MRNTKHQGFPKLLGNLQIKSWEQEDEDLGEKWREIGIHGDPEALRSLGKLLIAIADIEQKELDIPDGAREHFHLESDWELSKDSDRVILGRLDAKGTGEFPNSFCAANRKNDG